VKRTLRGDGVVEFVACGATSRGGLKPPLSWGWNTRQTVEYKALIGKLPTQLKTAHPLLVAPKATNSTVHRRAASMFLPRFGTRPQAGAAYRQRNRLRRAMGTGETWRVSAQWLRPCCAPHKRNMSRSPAAGG